MGLVNQTITFTAGIKPTASAWTNQFTTLYNLVNGSLDSANVDKTNSDGIMVLDTAQTRTATLTMSNANVLMASGGLVDLAGIADCLVLDDDGDTTISAPTDDQIDIEVGNSDVVAIATAGTTFSHKVTVGVDDTGYDVKLFGATASKFMVWDESADDLILADGVALQLGGDESTADGFKVEFDGTATLAIDALTANDKVSIGATTSTDFWLTSAGGTVKLDASADTMTSAGIAWDLTAGTFTTTGTLSAGATTVTSLNASDGNITNVGDIALDSISSDAGTTITVTLGTDAGDDFIVGNNNAFRVAGDTDNVAMGTASPASATRLTVQSSASITNCFSLLNRNATQSWGFNVDALSVNDGILTVTDNTGGGTKIALDTSGNLLLGGTSAGTSSVGNLHLFNGTAPSSTPTNSVILYAEDVSASSELKVRDEAGNITTLSPHNFSLIGEPSENLAWAYYSERDGKAVNVDMLKLARLVEKISGEKIVHIGEVA